MVEYVLTRRKRDPDTTPRLTFRQAAMKYLAENGYNTLDGCVGEVAVALYQKALTGDIAAIKLFLDRACGIQTQKVRSKSNHVIDAEVKTAALPADKSSYLKLFSRMQDIAQNVGLLKSPDGTGEGTTEDRDG